MRYNLQGSWLALGCLLALTGCTSTGSHRAAQIRYVDAHSHIATSITMDEEVLRLWQAGIDRIVLMDPDPAALAALAARNREFIIPFISAARTASMKGLRLEPGLAGRYAQLSANGAVCGFGELPTRLDPNPFPDDATALTTPVRQEIYGLADRLSFPVNLHVSLDRPETIGAVERIATDHPRMTLILAHAGWTADAATISGLMARHGNILADLSVRLDPAEGLPASPGQPASAHISILRPDGSLQPEWLAAIQRFPHRFLFGLDISADQRPLHIEQLVAAAKKALSGLPPRIHAAVAGGNLDRLLRACTLKPAHMPQEPPHGYEGVATAWDAASVTLRQRNGSAVSVPMKPGWTVARPYAASIDAIRTGDFIASINMGVNPSTGRAIELRIFETGYRPEAGTHALDDAGRWITHGIVREKSATKDGARLLIDQPGGLRTIFLPRNSRITAYKIVESEVLKVTSRVAAVTRRDADGVWRASRLTID